MVRRRVVLSGGLLVAGAATGTTAVAVARRERPPAGAPAELRIATGPPGAVYREIGAGLVAVLTGRLPHTRVRTIPTDASVENLSLLARGATDLALTSLDSTVAGLESGTPADVTAIARLYDSWLQLLVRAESPVQALSGLGGLPVAAGADGSGTRFTTDRLLALASVRPRLVSATQDEGAAALADGRVEALFTLTGVPTPAVTRLAMSRPVRMIPLGGFTEAMLDRYGDLYSPAVLPASAYPGIAATETMTTPNLLVARPELPDDVVELVTRTLFEERDRIARGHPEANRINVRTGIATGRVRLHPGALRYFRSAKP